MFIEKTNKRIAGIICMKLSSQIDTNALREMHWLSFEKDVFIKQVYK